MPTVMAPPPSHHKACWSSLRCTSPTPVSGVCPPLLFLCFRSSVPDTHLSTSSSGLHPHQSGGPIANPALYGGPPVSLSPGQPQQLLPPPFYPPPGVMTFPYPTMYPSPQVYMRFVILGCVNSVDLIGSCLFLNIHMFWCRCVFDFMVRSGATHKHRHDFALYGKVREY